MDLCHMWLFAVSGMDRCYSMQRGMFYEQDKYVCGGEKKMDFGVTGKLGGYYLAEQYRKNAAADKSGGVSFAELAAAKAAGQSDVSGMSFKDMWQTRFPGAYYHTMDAYKIPQGAWQRYDFPHEKFFSDEVDESVLDWKPTGAEPKLTDASVQSRIDSTLGKKAIVVPPALEEKMKNDPALARQVMARVESFIVNDQATLPPDRIYSCVVVLDENGEIAHAVGSSGGGNISGPTEAEMRQFEAEQAAKRKRREEYARLNEEAALKRRLMEQEADERYYKGSIAKEAVSIAAYEKNIMDVAGILK